LKEPIATIFSSLSSFERYFFVCVFSCPKKRAISSAVAGVFFDKKNRICSVIAVFVAFFVNFVAINAYAKHISNLFIF